MSATSLAEIKAAGRTRTRPCKRCGAEPNRAYFMCQLKERDSAGQYTGKAGSQLYSRSGVLCERCAVQLVNLLEGFWSGEEAA